MKKGMKKAANKPQSAKNDTVKDAVKKTKPEKGKIHEPVLNPDGTVANPGEVRDDDDPGDETQRRYRYQHAYGVILLVGSATGKLPYQSIWCEHHDDFLARLNGMFDSYQIKTSLPENGPWELTTEGFISAVKKFTQLERQFPGKINRYRFVSNTRTSNSTAVSKIHRSPDQLLLAVTSVTSDGHVGKPFQDALKALADKCEVDAGCLFGVLKRVEIVRGPSLDDFEAALSNDHLAPVPHCNGLIPAHINAIRDELIQKVHDASSNRVADPSKHWCCVNGDATTDPRFLAKQLPISLVEETIQQRRPIAFRYSPIATITDQRLTSNNLSKFEKKLIAGGLRPQLETMRRRTVSTEQHLLELAAKKPQEIAAIRNQLESYVQGVCDDANLHSTQGASVSGPDMLRQVQQKLEKTADDTPDMVFGETYDCLVGMAGLLTEACTVWWSPEFDLEENIS